MDLFISALKYAASGAVIGILLGRSGLTGTTTIPLKKNDRNEQVINHWMLPFVAAQWDTITNQTTDANGWVTTTYVTSTVISSRPLVFERT